MISVADALAAVLALAKPLPTEDVPLRDAAGRILAREVTARRTQPPFAAAAMDGYAVPEANPQPGASYRVIGEAAAGRGFDGTINPGEACRIFTGAPVPDGAAHVVIQEDVTRAGDQITILDTLGDGPNIRAAGGDFREGDRLTAPRRLTPADIALLAAMNIPAVPVTRKPVIALIATGDELVMPGEAPGRDQIIASNAFGLAAMIDAAGGIARLLPIARDNAPALELALSLAQGADMVVTIGGASVGDHDIVAQVAAGMGLERAFYKVAMRPGKPLMAGRIGGALMLGLPGNPVSAMVCGEIFLRPALLAMLGLPAGPAPRRTAPLAQPLPANGDREHYMRATLTDGALSAFQRQDSALLSVLSQADALIVRPPGDPARAAGDRVDYLPLI